MRRLAACSLFCALQAGAIARAEDAKGVAPAPKPAAGASGPTANGVRRDPKGIQGISPMWEAIAKGDSAVLARDYDSAIAAYRDAISKSPQDPLPHYRMGEAQKLKGDLKEATAAYENALRFATKDATLKGKALFCLADVSERAKDWDTALTYWTSYEELAKSSPKTKTYPATAAERKKRILEWKQIAADSAEVKARIERRLQEAEDTTRKNAK